VRAPRAVLVALLGGVALSFAYPEPDIGPLAWFALVPLLVLARGSSSGRALVLGLSFGVGFFGALLWWISLVGWLGWAVLVALEASFVALFALAWSLASRRGDLAWSLVAPAVLWVALEYARASVPLGGFTWGQLSQSQHDLEWLLRAAGLAGGWLVSALVVLVNACVARALVAGARARWREVSIAAGVGVAALTAPVLLPVPEAEGGALRVAIVQGNVLTGFDSLLDKELAILQSHERLTARLAGRDIDLVVWPESSVGMDIERVPAAASAVARAARAVGAPMIIGGDLDLDRQRYMVMAFHISAAGEVVDRYQKTHLVPFGEYVPARPLLDWMPILDQIPRDAIAGDDPVVFDVPGGRVAPVISFEGDFGSLVRARIAAGGRLLVVATNTSTWGSAWASAQHLAFSEVRAAENGVWVAHAALSGTSGFVAPSGEIRRRTPIGVATTRVETVRFATRPSLYARTGDWLPLGCIALGAAATALGATRPRPYRLPAHA
jgi:apolipoprotein N-acyltransferase